MFGLFKKKEKVQNSVSESKKIDNNEVKDNSVPKAKYRVVEKKRSVDTLENETIIYMKRGKVKKYVSIKVFELPYVMSGDERDCGEPKT